jgi:outer membrane PBP1 activator LpoA protein
MGLISGCQSNNQNATQDATRQPMQNIEPVLPSSTTPQALIRTAQQEWQVSANIRRRNSNLIAAADLFRQEQDCARGLKVIESVYKDIGSRANQIHADLLLAECAPLDQISVEERLSLLQVPARLPALSDRQKTLIAYLYASQSKWLDAAQTLAQTSNIDLNTTALIWAWINKLDYAEQKTSINSYPNIRSWLDVSSMLYEFGSSPELLRSQFDLFAQRYPEHPLVISPPAELVNGIELSVQTAQSIAVVLPLTGRLASQSNAIKQGILSAYYETPNKPQLTFLDSNALTTDELAEKLQQTQLIIGPLLKPTIEALTPKLSPDSVIVALNRVDETSTSSELETGPGFNQRFYFALAPEDEAIQMAEHVFSQGYRAPILVHAEDNVGQRLSAAFLQHWRQLQRQSDNQGITVVSYSDNDAMRDGISSALDVAQSKDRIKLLENLLIPELYNVPRNRRDIDVIVAFATPEQTELLNPIVESSLSPFTDKEVPVYVTSRSISRNVTKNQLRDLQNVHFLDLPWMMPEQDNGALYQQVDTLYPNQRDSSKRLFALGYDAYNQVYALPHLAAIPQLSVSALSGQLHVDDSHQVVRKLPLAVIDEEQIKVLVEP